MEFYTAYNRPPRVSVDCGGESVTQQQFAKECDINYIVKRAQRTGVVPVAPVELVYGIDDGMSFQDRMNNLAAVKEYFGSLPSEMRLKWRNDVAAFCEWMSNEGNMDEAVKLGLVVRDGKPASADVSAGSEDTNSVGTGSEDESAHTST